MNVVDANIILRYLLNDHEELSPQAKDIIENSSVSIPNEVIAEVVYVLEKVYKIPRRTTKGKLRQLIDSQHITVTNALVIQKALSIYASKRKLDIVDAMLCALAEIENHTILTFDKKMQKYLASLK